MSKKYTISKIIIASVYASLLACNQNKAVLHMEADSSMPSGSTQEEKHSTINSEEIVDTMSLSLQDVDDQLTKIANNIPGTDYAAFAENMNTQVRLDYMYFDECHSTRAFRDLLERLPKLDKIKKESPDRFAADMYKIYLDEYIRFIYVDLYNHLAGEKSQIPKNILYDDKRLIKLLLEEMLIAESLRSGRTINDDVINRVLNTLLKKHPESGQNKMHLLYISLSLRNVVYDKHGLITKKIILNEEKNDADKEEVINMRYLYHHCMLYVRLFLEVEDRLIEAISDHMGELLPRKAFQRSVALSKQKKKAKNKKKESQVGKQSETSSNCPSEYGDKVYELASLHYDGDGFSGKIPEKSEPNSSGFKRKDVKVLKEEWPSSIKESTVVYESCAYPEEKPEKIEFGPNIFDSKRIGGGKEENSKIDELEELNYTRYADPEEKPKKTSDNTNPLIIKEVSEQKAEDLPEGELELAPESSERLGAKGLFNMRGRDQRNILNCYGIKTKKTKSGSVYYKDMEDGHREILASAHKAHGKSCGKFSRVVGILNAISVASSSDDEKPQALVSKNLGKKSKARSKSKDSFLKRHEKNATKR